MHISAKKTHDPANDFADASSLKPNLAVLPASFSNYCLIFEQLFNFNGKIKTM
jgi:hypothetical protein